MVVIGGGITGAGVALDAAARGYSVALVEKTDYAAGTSSRSSKLVHGGLRYLQKFDLGLVREALLERQLMVKLAPHLVRPLQLVVPGLRRRGAEPDRRPRAEHVRRPEHGQAAPPRPAGQGNDDEPGAETWEEWSPERHRTISGEEVAELRAGAGPARPDLRLPLLRLPDRRRPARADRARRGGALRRDLRQRPRGGRAGRGGRPRGRRRRASTPRAASGSRSARANVVNATGVWADRIRPEELLRRGGDPASSGPAAAPTSRSPPSRCR